MRHYMRNVLVPGLRYLIKYRIDSSQKENGEWLHTDPLNGQGWVEANAWQATWSVSHDLPKLVELMGGGDAFCKN